MRQRVAVSATRGGHVFEADLAAVAARSIDTETTLRTALRAPSDPLFGTAPASGTYNASADPKLQNDNPLTGGKSFSGLAQQLQMVARMIDASSAAGIGAKRQVLFVSLGGFDMHDNENRTHADLMARLAHAMRYFDTTLGAMGAQSKVTTFTASDFGRTFTSNGDGTDHGWGGHHFVMGGAVKGGDIYGKVPVLGAKNANNNDFDSSPNQIGNGSLLPTTSRTSFGEVSGHDGRSAIESGDRAGDAQHAVKASRRPTEPHAAVCRNRGKSRTRGTTPKGQSCGVIA